MELKKKIGREAGEYEERQRPAEWCVRHVVERGLSVPPASIPD